MRLHGMSRDVKLFPQRPILRIQVQGEISIASSVVMFLEYTVIREYFVPCSVDDTYMRFY
jgi:hypothetical protein